MAKMLRAGLAGAATMVLLTTVGYGTALADDDDGESIRGDGTSLGSNEFEASNDSDDPFDAEGYYRGESPFGPAFTLEGPITCLEVDGNRAGFIYQIEGDSFPLFKGMEVKISVEENEDGDDRIGFEFPQPSGSADDCAPGQTREKFDGDLDINNEDGDD